MDILPAALVSLIEELQGFLKDVSAYVRPDEKK